jgi:hypothetical protein
MPKAHNDIKVATTSTYGGLFNMLQAERFAYLPRDVNEAWAELKNGSFDPLLWYKYPPSNDF